MSGIYNGPPRGGTRGGRDQFSWDAVKSDKDRECYLGHSVKASTGRWQQGRDIFWYTRDRTLMGAQDEDPWTRAAEVEAVKQREEDLMRAALGLPPGAPGRDNIAVTVEGNRKADGDPSQKEEKDRRHEAAARVVSGPEARRRSKERVREERGIEDTTEDERRSRRRREDGYKESSRRSKRYVSSSDDDDDRGRLRDGYRERRSEREWKRRHKREEGRKHRRRSRSRSRESRERRHRRR